MRVALASLLGEESIQQRIRGGWTVFNNLEFLGANCIAGVAKELGHSTRIFHPFQFDDGSDLCLLDAIRAYKPDVIGFSSMTNTIPRVFQMADYLKRTNPCLKIVLGGDHASTMPKDIAGTSIDYAVIGEGETAFGNLLESIQNNFDVHTIPGIAINEGDVVHMTELQHRDRIRTVVPLRDKTIIEKSRVGAIMYPPASECTGTASFVYQLGCPLGCTYCSATSIFGGRVTSTSEDRMVDEIKSVTSEYNPNAAFFTDLTFNLWPERAISLCNRLASENLGLHWAAMIRPTSPKGKQMISEKLLEAMAHGGASKVGFGVESTLDSAMKDFHRPTNLDHDEYVLRTLDRFGVLSKIFLIMGHPDETIEYYDTLISNLKKLQADEVRISFLTAFPGTQLWNVYSQNGTILTNDYSKYTTFQPTLKLKNIEPSELLNQRRRVLREYYGSSEYTTHIAAKIYKFPHLAESFKEFQGFLKAQKVI